VTHIRDVAGEDHVGIGAGYDGINRYMPARCDFRCSLIKSKVRTKVNYDSHPVIPNIPCIFFESLYAHVSMYTWSHTSVRQPDHKNTSIYTHAGVCM